MMEPVLCPGTLEVNMDWDRKARRGAAVADKLNYTGRFIIADELPYSFGESVNYEYFNRVALQPQYRKVPRNTLKRRTQQSYYAYRGYLMEMFRTYDGRVSLTSDTWTSTYGEPFVCVTAHWIDNDWLLQKRIICFEAMEEAHNGFNIKSRIVSCCKNFHLVDKIFSISLDNATANTSAMQFLKEDPSIKLVLDGSLMHVRCCAHILNLCVQDGLDELRTLLEPIRNVIRWIRAARSAKRIYKQKCEEYGLRKKVIALDTPTRWNSTYKLLHDAIAYRDVLTDMYNESRATDGQFITNDHWSLAKIVHDVLETFDNATHIFSYVYEPNIHTVILECIKIICTIKQTSLANPGVAVKRLLDNMKVKWCAYFTEFPPIYAIAAILDPGVKLEAVIQPQPVGSSMGASRFGILGPVLKKSRPDGLDSSIPLDKLMYDVDLSDEYLSDPDYETEFDESVEGDDANVFGEDDGLADYEVDDVNFEFQGVNDDNADIGQLWEVEVLDGFDTSDDRLRVARDRVKGYNCGVVN
ncbi:putative AC transposase [Bienertia sinuspersici]